MTAIRGFVTRLLCTHDWKRFRTIHGDEANYARSEWRCTKCNKHRYSIFINEMEQDVPKEPLLKRIAHSIRYTIGSIAFHCLNKEDRDAIYRDYRMGHELRTVETWMCEFPQAVETARYLRVHSYGYKDDLPFDHPDRHAARDISCWREDFRRRFK
ncbi:hypothetical protein JA13_048 [Dickeya phage vB_DsoM_JA13]|uniref:Uncharacterized protein n=1 Tax=Dickeya phage vB_DsoM_JA13 TaxID=2283030 RepID=A0A384ZW28_9CAUD|nr:hypothetical protein JA13_048 [Dickeya phage vB_DsoM_JA13]